MIREKKKKEQKLFENIRKVTLDFIQGKGFSPCTKKDLIARLQVHEKNVKILDAVLVSLKKEGKIVISGKKYHLNEQDSFRLESGEKVVRGQITVLSRGYGFVNQPAPGEDIFIPKTRMNDALDEDIVDVAIDTTAFSGKGPEGRIVRVVERKRTQLTGVVTDVYKNSIHLYSCLLGEHHHLVYTCPKNTHLKVGDRAIFAVKKWGNKDAPTTCTLTERIGSVDEVESDLAFIIKSSELRVDFPEKAIKEASFFGSKVTSKDMEEREDLRDLECFTIDPDTAKDFDDAVSLDRTKSGFRLGVHIADVSYYVREGSAIDVEAKKRCNSTYFPGTCIPMLPRELSEGLCSLRPGVNRLTVSVFFDIDKTGETKGWKIVRSVIKSKKRFTYKEVKHILDGKKLSVHAPKLAEMQKFCHLLQKKRHERGSVQLSLPELVVKVDEKGVPTGTEMVEYDITHQMIEEFMLKANEVVAIELSRRGKEVSYRVHEEPSKESLQDFAQLVMAFGFSIPASPSPQDIQKFFLEAEGSPHAAYLAVCYIRSMRLACYSPDNIGHYGLSLEHYCHFTSPIRRYVDTIIHRLLLEEGPSRSEIETICKEASDSERKSARAESSLITLKKLRLLQSWRNASPHRKYVAIVTRVKPFGISFDIADLMLEGFLHVSELEDDFFLFNDATRSLIGQYEGISYHSGEKLLVRCTGIDLILQEASWSIVQRESVPQKRRKPEKKEGKK